MINAKYKETLVDKRLKKNEEMIAEVNTYLQDLGKMSSTVNKDELLKMMARKAEKEMDDK